MQHPRPRNLGSGEMISPIMDTNHQARMAEGKTEGEGPLPNQGHQHRHHCEGLILA